MDNSNMSAAHRAAIKKRDGDGYDRKIRYVDAETGQRVNGNEDVVDLAKFSIQRMGTGFIRFSDYEIWVNKNWYVDVQCAHCKNTFSIMLPTAYKDGFRCFGCWKDNAPLESDKMEEIEKTYSYIERYVTLRINDKLGREAIVKEYRINVLGEKSEQEQ